MNGINEVLINQHGAAWRETYQFTVNNLVADVSLNDDPGVSHILRGAKDYNSGAGVLKGRRLFSPNDNIRILSIGVKLPHSFVLAQTAFFVRLVWHDFPGVTSRLVSQIGSFGSAWVPGGNYELITDVYVPYSILVGNTAGFFLVEVPTASSVIDYGIPKISQLGVPVLINGSTQDVIVFMKINHNLDMIDG